MLYVRDVLDLRVEPALGVPPGLIEKLPDRSELLEPSDRIQAAREWLNWWETVARYESRVRVDSGFRTSSQTVSAPLSTAKRSTPSGGVLSGTVLQPAAKAVFSDAQSWGGRVDMPEPGGVRKEQNAFAWEVTRDTAEVVAAAHGVDVGAIDGAASILFVEGVWWDLVAPGHVFCSLTAANDPVVVGEMLQSVFESRLAAA